jgi:hypothetical protein
VRAAAIVSVRPLREGGAATTYADASRPLPAGVGPPVADVRYADPQVFAALSVPLLEGRPLGKEDGAGAPPRAVVSRAAAHALWQDAPAAGRTVRIQLFGEIEAEVVGVVDDVRLANARTAPRPTIWLSSSRFPSSAADLVVRGEGRTEDLARTIERAVHVLDPALPLYDVAPLDDTLSRSLARERFVASLLAAFSLASLLLAAVGVFGVFTADVARRRRELGIRLALGARPAGLVATVLESALAKTALGLVLGAPAAFIAGRLMSSLLYGVRPFDARSFGVSAFVLAASSLLAAFGPALSAARTSALTALKSE